MKGINQFNCLPIAVGLLAVSSVAQAHTEAPGYTIENISTQFACSDLSEDNGTLELVGLDNNQQSLRATFLGGEMRALVSPGGFSDKKTCELEYTIIPKPGYRVSHIGFSAAGNYLATASSINNVRVRHRLDFSAETFSYQTTFSEGSDSFDNVIASVDLSDNCGDPLVVETSMITEVISFDGSVALVSLDQGQGGGGDSDGDGNADVDIDLADITVESCSF
ncbi:hypothetical protein [Shewanella surugensis]|uniref:Secreted protein n=1 Tax=Shewanella surugensis TaxID=212020 RepID=A0ABT0LHZ5_9GAMM|nr:hypothetical protein [Shewanella surugensis]MCL1127327.1 hypothetical protein [Shewanella surugensis]